jgi:hypothetical protein
MSEDILIDELKKEFSREKVQVLYNIKDKEFITSDGTIITCWYKAVNGELKPNLTLNRNATTFSKCLEFQEKNPNCCKLILPENLLKLHIDVISPIFETSNITKTTQTNIMQFPRINPEINQIYQWSGIPALKTIIEIEPAESHPTYPNSQHIMWFNFENKGFIFCAVNQGEKTLIFSSSDFKNRLIGKFAADKRTILNRIIYYWPELKTHLDPENNLLFFNMIINIFNKSSSNGIFRITKFHTSNKMICVQTHIE